MVKRIIKLKRFCKKSNIDFDQVSFDLHNLHHTICEQKELTKDQIDNINLRKYNDDEHQQELITTVSRELLEKQRYLELVVQDLDVNLLLTPDILQEIKQGVIDLSKQFLENNWMLDQCLEYVDGWQGNELVKQNINIE